MFGSLHKPAALRYCLNISDSRRSAQYIRFKNQNIVHTIATKDILYIIRDKDRKCTIQTTDNQIIVNKTLIELKNMLDNRFVYAHRACIVNYDRISQFDKKNKIILFDNNMETDLVSSRFKMDDA